MSTLFAALGLLALAATAASAAPGVNLATSGVAGPAPAPSEDLHKVSGEGIPQRSCR